MAITKNNSILFLCVIALTFSLGSYAQVNVYPLYLEDSTPRDYYHTVIRDQRGFIWAGTDTGLRFYNGYKLSDFRAHPGAPEAVNKSISKIVEDQHGDLWIGGNQLSRYNFLADKFDSYDVSDGKRVWAIHADDDGTVWIGGDGFGLRAIDIDTGEILKRLFHTPSPFVVHAILPHGDSSSLWISLDSKLVLLNTDDYSTTEFAMPDGWIWDVMESRTGDIWFASSNGVYRLNPATREYRHYQALPGVEGALQSYENKSLLEDASGQIWIGSDKLGVHKYVPESDSFIHYPSSVSKGYSFPPGSISDIYEDETGSLWFTVAKFGIFRVSENLERFRSLKHDPNEKNSLAFDNVMDLHEAPEGRIWIATDGGGLNEYTPDTGQFVLYRHDPLSENSLNTNSILALEGDEQALWIGTWAGGLNKLDLTTGQFTHLTAETGEGLAENNVFRLFEDQRGRLFVSVWDRGLQIYDSGSGTFQSFLPGRENDKSGIRNYAINDIEPTGDGRYWIGGLSGVEIFNSDTNTFTTPAGLEALSVNALLQIPNGSLWVASNEGLIRYNGSEKVAHYTVAEGLSDNSVVSIEVDKSGYLWLGTRNGLNRFDTENETFIIFDRRDGLAGNQFNRFSHLYASDGMMYFGGTDGITFFHPEKLPFNTQPPEVYLSSLELIRQSSTTHSDENHTIRLFGHEALDLEYEQRHFAIKFTSTSFISPDKNRYRYRLKGLEDGWTEVSSSRRNVRYTNLDPGKYSFEVVAANNDGFWSNEPSQIAITIHPAWWQTWWARTLYMVAAGVVIYLFILWNLHKSKKQRLVLAEQVAQKTAQLGSANQAIIALNKELEKKIEKRTQALTVEEQQRREAEAKLFYMAFHDPITELPNRPWLIQKLERLIARSQHDGTHYALLFIDGDRFKKINDTHGHLIGDALLKEAAQRLTELLPQQCHAVRLGGDEFTVLVEKHDDCASPSDIPEKIIEAFNQPFHVEQLVLYFRVSVGMVICDNNYAKPEDVLRDADIAMYKAKEQGRGRYQVFTLNMLGDNIEQAKLESDLHLAVSRNELFLEYQPVVELHSSRLVSFECLLRWRHPEHGVIPPDRFIPIAEETGLIFDMGLWVISEACQQLRQWQAHLEDTSALTVAVNLSALQLNQADLISKLDDVLAATQIDGSLLKLEITETALMENSENVNIMLDSLISRSIELAIDDFGTGYSSLSYLDKLPVQVLKIDRSFVDSLINRDEYHEGAQEIVKATISLAHNLNIEVVAEGIETQDQWDFLAANGCDYGQGFHISKPLSAADATIWVRNNL